MTATSSDELSHGFRATRAGSRSSCRRVGKVLLAVAVAACSAACTDVGGSAGTPASGPSTQGTETSNEERLAREPACADEANEVAVGDVSIPKQTISAGQSLSGSVEVVNCTGGAVELVVPPLVIGRIVDEESGSCLADAGGPASLDGRYVLLERGEGVQVELLVGSMPCEGRETFGESDTPVRGIVRVEVSIQEVTAGEQRTPVLWRVDGPEVELVT